MCDIDKNMYKVYLIDAKVKSIRTVKLAKSDKGRYTPWEIVIIPQNFIPQSVGQIT